MGRLFAASLQAKLIGAFVLVVVVALGIAGAVFVRARDQDARRARLDHVAAESGAINTEFTASQFEEATLAQLSALAKELAEERDVRILLVDGAKKVAYDSAGDDGLAGETLSLPETIKSEASEGSPFLALRPPTGTPGEGLIIVVTRERADDNGGRPEQQPNRGPGQGGAAALDHVVAALARDVNRDGTINANDARACTTQCTKLRCAL